MRLLFYAVMAAFVLAFGSSGGAVAQSFDCKRATTMIEKIICGHEYDNLRDIDAELGRAFSRRIQGTSAAESRRLLLEQRLWLALRLEACRFGSPSRWQEILEDSELLQRYLVCLEDLYWERIEALNRKPIDLKLIDLVYSGDDGVCPRLHKAMNSYHERNPGVWSFLEKNAFPTILELAGFESVRWLDSEDAKVFEDHGSFSKAMIFEGDVFGDGTTRFVNMSYKHSYFLSNSYSSLLNYFSVVFILNERFSKESAISLRSYWKESDNNYVPFEDVALAITFYASGVAEARKFYKEITFDSPLIRFSFDIGISELAAEFRTYPLSMGEGAAQYPMEINGRVYFFFGSEPFSELGVLYRVVSDFSVEIVCLTKGNTERYIPR